MNKVTFLFFIGICCFFLGTSNSYGQADNCGITLDPDSGGCSNHNLIWSEVDNAGGYRIVAKYFDETAQYSTTIPELTEQEIEDYLIAIPGSVSDGEYTLTITPHSNHSRKTTNPGTKKYNSEEFFSCSKILQLKNCGSGGNGNGQGGSKSFVPMEAGGGGTNTPLVYTGSSPFKTQNPTTNQIQVEIAPNPVDADLYVTTTNPKAATKATTTIYNTSGQQMLQLSNQKALDKGTQVSKYDVSELPAGIYYYILQTGETKISQKIIKM